MKNILMNKKVAYKGDENKNIKLYKLRYKDIERRMKCKSYAAVNFPVLLQQHCQVQMKVRKLN